MPNFWRNLKLDFLIYESNFLNFLHHRPFRSTIFFRAIFFRFTFLLHRHISLFYLAFIWPFHESNYFYPIFFNISRTNLIIIANIRLLNTDAFSHEWLIFIYVVSIFVLILCFIRMISFNYCLMNFLWDDRVLRNIFMQKTIY